MAARPGAEARQRAAGRQGRDRPRSTVHTIEVAGNELLPTTFALIQPAVNAALVPQTNIATGAVVTGPLTLQGAATQNDTIPCPESRAR